MFTGSSTGRRVLFIKSQNKHGPSQAGAHYIAALALSYKNSLEMAILRHNFPEDITFLPIALHLTVR